MSAEDKTKLVRDVILLVVGFVLTGVAGAFISARFQKAAAERDLAARRFDADLQRATQVYDEITRLAGRYLAAQRTDNDTTTALTRQIRFMIDNHVKADGKMAESMASDEKASSRDYIKAGQEWTDGRQRLGPLIRLYFGDESTAALDFLTISLTNVEAALYARKPAFYPNNPEAWQREVGTPDVEKVHADAAVQAILQAEQALGVFATGVVTKLRAK